MTVSVSAGEIPQDPNHITQQRQQHAKAIAAAGGMEAAMASGALPRCIGTTLSEAIVLGLLRQGVRSYFVVLGHGSTEVGEVLRVYEAEGLVRTYCVRHETEAAHAAMALRWVTGEKAAVACSIGPGPLHAIAGSLAAASDGVGIWFLLGDETTQDEGPNMQQIPKEQQNTLLQLCNTIGTSYCLHTPEAIGTALRRGLAVVDHPYRGGPFYLLMPLNTQPARLPRFNLDELPAGAPPRLGAAADDGAYAAAAAALRHAERVVVKVGGGARNAGQSLADFLDLADAVAVTSPLVSGIIPFNHPRNMTVGGSKGTISGNFAMEEADLLVAIGTRAVCQSDCSRTGYPKVKKVVNINADWHAATHYAHSIALVGDAAATLAALNHALRALPPKTQAPSSWFAACRAKRLEWDAFRQARYDSPRLFDPVWGKEVLTQPAAIKTVSDWARARDAVAFFDAGDVQANGFQIVEDDRLGRTFTETGASYMGFAVSALLATAAAQTPFYGVALTGDGSFTMNPQILIDGVMHGAHGCIVLFDNRRMGAISGLQDAQYGAIYATSDGVEVDYAAWAAAVKGVAAFRVDNTIEELIRALDQAYEHRGLALIHVPVYWGPDPLGGMGVFGRWNVGNWCDNVQTMRHEIGL